VVAEWTLDDRNPHTRSLTCRRSYFAWRPRTYVAFEIPRAATRRASFGWNTDDRPLGFSIGPRSDWPGDIELPIGKLPRAAA